MTETPVMELHLLNATGALGPVGALLHSRIRAAHELAAEYLPLGPLDIVVQAGARVVPEKGHGGYTPTAAHIFVTVDPANPALVADENRSLERMIAHELHHAARWAGPGYGATLGEALVSEGLACRFVRELYGPPHEPWEIAVSSYEQKAPRARAAAEWDAAHDHGAWFLGTGGMPRWLGYALGTSLVEAGLADGESAADLAHAHAARFRPA